MYEMGYDFKRCVKTSVAQGFEAVTIKQLAKELGCSTQPIYWFMAGRGLGVAIGMSIALVFRGTIFIRKLKLQKWTQFQII